MTSSSLRRVTCFTFALAAFGLPCATQSFARDRADKPPQAPDSTLAPAIPIIAPGSAYRQANLVSDSPGLAPVQDPLLVNPWGISKTASSSFWVANAGTSTSTLYRGDVGGSPLVRNPAMPRINIPGGLPTGTVANPSMTDFVVSSGMASGPAHFLFASITGNITGWNPNVPAAGSITGVIAASHPGHVYTGLAVGSSSGNNFLYAADFANGRIDVFNTNFALQPAASFPFADPTIPTTAGNRFHPYNVQAVGSSLYVTYAKVGSDGLDEEGVGNGFVRRFNTAGVRDLTFGINNGPLNSPWGLVVAPASFGIFGGALLVGNFGEGNPSIHAFNQTTGAFLGTLQDESGNGIVIDELWALTFGNGDDAGDLGGDPTTLYFTAGIGEEEHGLFGSLKPTTASATSLIQFSTDEFVVSEGIGHIDVTITRAGDVSGSATVNYATFDVSQPGQANQKSDYQIALGKVTFDPGETSQTFRIFLVDDRFVETGGEKIDLVLSNPTGAGVGLGTPNTATVEILDNDLAAPTVNPIDEAAFFIRQLYLDFLNREPEAATLNFLASHINSCGSDTNCTKARRVKVATAFFLSAEFHQTGTLVFLANKAAFGALPFSSSPVPVLYGQFMRDLQLVNQGIAFAEPGWPAQLAANQFLLLNDFVLRPTFVNAYPSTLTPDQFVDALYANAGVTPTAEERQAAIDDYNASSGDTAARARVLRRVTQNSTFAANEFTRSFIAFAFFGFDRRDPDAGAFNALLATLNSAGGDHAAAGTIKTFIEGLEYRQRFGPSPSAAAPAPTPSPTPALSLNLSTRGRVGTGDNVMIGGVIITGSGNKELLLRAIGPSLQGSSNIGAALPDPVLEVRASDGTLVESNDDWRTNQAEVEATGIAPTDDRESALIASLAPGAYTAIVSGKGTDTGVALVEAYDLDLQPGSSQLGNISTRGLVQTQDNVLIGGFILGGTSNPATIAVRAIGPSLVAAGLENPLADPKVELHDSNGVTLRANDNWRDTQELEILTLGIPPGKELEAAIVATPPPGAFTAIVSGNDSGVGIGVVEIYNVR